MKIVLLLLVLLVILYDKKAIILYGKTNFGF